MECQVCLECYDREKNTAVKLECYHLLCVNCLNELKEDGRITCPMCLCVSKVDGSKMCMTVDNILKHLYTDEQEVDLIIRTLKKKVLDVRIRMDQTVSLIKNSIKEVVGLDPQSQILVYKNKCLKDQRTIRECNLDSLCVIYLVQK